MKRFVEKHQPKITGTISCFDRILFKGHLPLNWPDALEQLITRQGLRIKDFKEFVPRQSYRLSDYAKRLAQQAGRPYIYLNGFVRKEDRAKAIAAQDKITDGLVCILSAIEPCNTFKLAYGDRHPRVVRALRKCLCLYFYFVDREFGFLHIRLQTWFPFTLQVCLNGHDWLARKLDRHGIGHRKLDNAFLAIDDPGRAQRFANEFTRRNWPRILSAFARRVNPLLATLLCGMDYHWVTEQAEFATDVMFRDRASLKDLYGSLLKHATLCFSAEDVMTFLGRKLNGTFAGEILNDYRKRWPGARVRHRMKQNWIKMYDKHGSILRIETVINSPYEFKIRRRGTRNGRTATGWFPMPKGVAFLHRYAQIGLGVNQRYLDALAVVDDPAEARDQIRSLARPVRSNGRPYRGFNPADEGDVRLFAALLRGEHAIHGFRNRDLRAHLFPPARNDPDRLRQGARVSRLLKRLHVRGLVAKIPRSRRWRVTARGHAILATVVTLHHRTYPELLMNSAA